MQYPNFAYIQSVVLLKLETGDLASLVTIQGVKTNRYLCLNRIGHIVTRVRKSSLNAFYYLAQLTVNRFDPALALTFVQQQLASDRGHIYFDRR